MKHKDTVPSAVATASMPEPTTIRPDLARFYAEMDRNKARLIAARAAREVATGAIPGWSAPFANIDPRVGNMSVR